MPLPELSPESAEQSAARQRQAQLRDMEANGGQFAPQLVQGDDGRLYLAWRSTHHQADEAPYPKGSPAFNLPGLLDDDAFTNAGNDAALGRMEASISDYGIQSPADEQGRSIITRANCAGISPVHAFQVIWLGSRRQWLVAPGMLRWTTGRMEDHPAPQVREYPRTFLDAGTGWITLRCEIQPENNDGHALETDRTYELMPPTAPRLEQNPRQRPSLRTVTFGPGGIDVFITQTSGTIHLPIAWVSPPGRGKKSPEIHQYVRSSYYFSDPRWTGALPIPTIA